MVIRPGMIVEYILSTPPEHSVMLLGPPGIGKSVQVRRAGEVEAREMGREFIDFHDGLPRDYFDEPERYYVYTDLRLTECVPEDLLGYPRPVDSDHYVYAPPLWARAMSVRGGAGLLFLDEITNVQRDDVLSVSYKVICDRKVGFIRLSPLVRVVAAGNEPEHSEVARPLPAPLISRMEVVRVSAPSIEDWARYMDEEYGDRWDRRVLAFLTRFSDKFLPSRISAATLEQYPCPRNWTRLAVQLGRVPPHLVEEKAAANVGREVAPVLATFLSTRVPSLDELVSRPESFRELSVDAKLLCAVMAGSAFKLEDADRLMPLLNVVAESPELAVLAFMSIPIREKRRMIMFIIRNREERFCRVLYEAGVAAARV